MGHRDRKHQTFPSLGSQPDLDGLITFEPVSRRSLGALFCLKSPVTDWAKPARISG
jgi:hypothetical protein